jgi:hypothetical protein
VEVVTTQPGIIALLPERVEDLRERRMFLGGMSDVTRAEIRQSAGGFIRIKKRADDVWIMQQPVNNARLNTARVMQILGRLDNVTAIRFIEDEEHPYGLAEGEVVASATLWTDAGGVRTLLLGGPAGDDTGEVYAACKETGLRCTVDDAILDLLSVKPDALRSRALFTIPHTDVASLVLRDGDRQLVLKRSGDEWSIVEPRHWRADDGIINAIVVGLTAIHIEEFFDNVHTNLAEFGLLETDRSIELSTGSEEAERLLIGRSTEDGKSMFVKFAGEKDPVLKAATAVIGSILSGHFGLPEDIDPQPPSPNNGEVPLWISPLRYCDRGMLRLKRSTVTSLQLSKPGVVAQEVRKSADGVWRVVSPEGGVMVEKVVAETLLAASDLRAARVEYRTGVGLSEYGLDHPGISLTFGFAAGNAEGISKTLSMGYLAGDEGMYAMIQGREVVFVLDTETAGRLMRSIVRSPTAGPSGESDAK